MKQQREHWASRVGFIMAAAGSAIGLGSLWRFPYIAGENGGGAFVLLYIIFTLVIGLPVFISELIIGRRAQKSAVLAYSELLPSGGNWKMLGWLNVVSCFIILSYYSVVAGWCSSYVLMSVNQFTVGKSPEQIGKVFETLFSSADINLLWLFIFILLNVGVVFSGVRKGIEHWSRILTPALMVILLVLFGYALTMEGFPKAFEFVMKPDFSKLTPSGILNALGMAFFTLSVGLGIILTYGSYMKSTENIPKNGVIVASMTLLVSLIAALMIFPIVFTFGFDPQGGPGLVFQTMPILFAKLPGSLVISTVFFILFVFTALTSSISLLEMLVANFIELLGWSRGKAVVVCSSITFILGIPSAMSGSGKLFPTWKAIYGRDFFDTMNYITASWMMPIAGLLTTIYIGWVLDRKITQEEFQRGGSMKSIYFRLWFFSIRYLAPVAVIAIILQESGVININSWFN